MFAIESYLTPILLSYVDKYVKDFKPADAQVSLWGGGVVLHNLVLKEDVLQRGVSLPFRLVSGRIHELHIQVPWTKIMSEPIVVTIDTIECVLSLNPPAGDANQVNSEESRKEVVETPPGYMQALVRRIVSNIAVKVHHLILKYVDDDIVLSLNVKQMSVESVASDWTPAFTDISHLDPILRRLVRLDDLTLCLDQTESDGKIRVYQEPLLYRCQLTFRILTRLVSATTRRSQYLDIQILSSKLAWSVTSDQLLLLIRLARERAPDEVKSSMKKAASTSPQTGQSSTFSPNGAMNQTEASRRESWSDWAWSWLPSWSDREGMLEESPLYAEPVPLHLAAHFDSVSVVYKVMEEEQANKKRARAVLELKAECFAIKSSICNPTLKDFSLGMKYLKLESQGKCVCGHLDANTVVGEPTVYLLRSESLNNDGYWKWPDDDNDDTMQADASTIPNTSRHQSPQMCANATEEEGKSSDIPSWSENKFNETMCRNYKSFWQKLKPVFYLEHRHERTPSTPYTDPYDNPPTDFENSDWREEYSVNLRVEPIEIRICMGLIHRVNSIVDVLKKMPPVSEKERSMRVLTVEECEALAENLPCRVINMDLTNLKIAVNPWDHSLSEPPSPTPLALYIDIPKTNFFILMPLYPNRVCSAACQLETEDTSLSRGSRLHFTSTMGAIQVSVANPQYSHLARPLARIDLKVVVHILLNQKYFSNRDTILASYSVLSKDINIGGSSARLRAAYEVVSSLLSNEYSSLLKSSTLPQDALNDQEAAIVDLSSEELSIKGFFTKTTSSHTASLQTAKATVLHAPGSGELKQAWLFSAPDVATTLPYLRLALQTCDEPNANTLNYISVWTEPTAVCIDPLLVALLAYRPQQVPGREPPPAMTPRVAPSTSHMTRRRSTPPLQSMGVPPCRSGSGSELIHTPRPRSQASGSGTKPGKASTTPEATKETLRDGKLLIQIYTYLKKILVHVEIGFIVVYITPNSASALDSATLRDALERHTAAGNKIFVASLGRLSVHSNFANKQLWRELRFDGVTAIPTTNFKPETEDSFPWRISFSDVTCYTLQVHVSDRNIDRNRSQLRVPSVIVPKTVLDLLTTTVTLSVVTKHKAMKKDKGQSTKQESTSEKKEKYFTQGLNFKPSTVAEFLRGPAQRDKDTQNEPSTSHKSKENEGPLVYLGLCLYADTPPIYIRIDQDQCDVVTMAIHTISHLLSLFRQEPMQPPRTAAGGSQGGGSSHSVKRSISELEEPGRSNSDTHSDRSMFVPIFESPVEPGLKVKTSFWFQWVKHRITLVTTSSKIMFTFNIEDIISTVDCQTNYNQFKFKIASASLKHHEWRYNEWHSSPLRGRVIEGREPTASADGNRFLTVTVTQAEVASLPANWKEDFHPKFMEKSDSNPGYPDSKLFFELRALKASALTDRPPQLFTTSPPLTTTTTEEKDYIWEVNAVVAPLEALLTPQIMRNAAVMLRKFWPVFACPVPDKSITSNRSIKWPYVFINAGGFRLFVSTEDYTLPGDNTLVITVNKVFVNPHPENPVLRNAPSGSNEGSWGNVNPGPEGRQYEILVHNLIVQSAQFAELLNQELTSMEMNGNGANPALMWAQPPVTPTLTTILNPLQMSYIVAPAVYVGGTLASNFALEVNLISDCNVDVDLSQLNLLTTLAAEISAVVKSISNSVSGISRVQCAYATMILSQENVTPNTSDERSSVTGETRNRSKQSFDSDFESASSNTNSRTGSMNPSDEVGYKRQASVAFADEMADSSDNIDFYFTAGNIRTTLYAVDNNSPLLSRLRLPSEPNSSNESDIVEPKRKKEKIHKAKSIDSLGGTMSSTDDKELKPTKSTTDLLKIEATKSQPIEGRIPLLTMALHQPNIYIWRRRSQKCMQVSLFNAWLGLGSSPSQGGWNLVLFHTKKGQPDLLTEIPPSLLTSKLLVPVTTGNFNAGNVASRGSLNISIDRPCMLEISIERIERLKSINDLARMHMQGDELPINTSSTKPPLFKIRKLMMDQGVEIVKVCTKQIGVQGSEGVAGWDECSLQIAATSRYDRLLVKGLITALQVTAAPNNRNWRSILHPLVLGIDTKLTWEAWQRAESGNMTEQPIVNLRVDLDRVTVDLVPDNLKALNRLADATRTALNKEPPTKSVTSSTDRVSFGKSSTVELNEQKKFNFSMNKTPQFRESSDHYYKDDLRSGAFKIMTGNQLPMAYQIMLQEDAVAWRYPHPRAITRFVALPLPNQNEEVHSVLEYYSSTLSRWEPHTWFKLPIAEAREITFLVTPPDAVFASMWRCRTCNGIEEQPPFEFVSQHFTFGTDHAVPDQSQDTLRPRTHTGVSPQALSGVLRVDSYFSPKHLSRCKLAVQVTSLDVHLYNKLPHFSRNGNPVKGHYISKHQTLRSHRIMSLVTRDNVLHAHLGASAGKLVMLHTRISSDVLESSTGLMERFLHECRIQAAVALPEELKDFRLRLCSTPVMVSLQLLRLRALMTHVNQWRTAISEYQKESTGIAPCDNFQTTIPADNTQNAAHDLPTTLEGLISLWVKNECSVAMRMGQESTDEYVLLPSGAMLAYRWRNPDAPKRLRFCLETEDARVEWSESVSFQDKEMCVRIVKNGEASEANTSSEVCIYTRVEDYGVRMCMRLFGRVRLANMLKENVAFKIQARNSDSSPWKLLTVGEMTAESLNPAVLCANDCELTLKIRFHQYTSWSGDIPLKECVRENFAWLVKIPYGNNLPYLAAWCRVVCGRTDGQILATLWPLYTLQSYLPLDLDVLITTILDSSVSEVSSAALVQEVPGRGECTHLMTPGTSFAKHSLTLRYKNLETPVTRDMILLNYNMTSTPLFENYIPVNKIDEIVTKITQWLDCNKSGQSTAWPYSCVARYWEGQWIPAVNQPRSDITITYSPVCAGGDCSLQLQLRPAAIFCNGAQLPLTLRFHDASPLCKIEPGEVVAGPSSILIKPFFVSLEVGHLMYMSIELRLWQSEPGRYAPLPPGCVALDRPARISVPCYQKVIFLTLFYELKNDINVFGFTSTYRLINRLGTKILVAGAVSRVGSASAETRPPCYEVIEANATGPGMQLSMFWLMDPWEDADLDSITIYLWVALPDDMGRSLAHVPVPIVLGKNATRNAFELRHPANRSIPVVATQQILDGCGVITIAEDPYPQYYIKNYTHMSLFVGEPPSVPSDNGSWFQNKIPSECPGLQWYWSIEPASAVHYTTPTYCERHLANNSSCQSPRKLPFLAFANATDKSKTTVEWSPPAAITDGEQLLQVPGLKTIKLRVTVHPHSTLIELQNVDQNDISASEIRRRLQGTSFEPVLPVITEIQDNTLDLEKALNQIHEVDLLLQCASDNSVDVEINESPDAASDANHEHGISQPKADLGEKPSESLGASNNATSASSTSCQYTSTSSSVTDNLRSEESAWPSQERVRCVLEGVVLSLSSAPHSPPLLVTHLDHVALHLTSTQKGVVVRTSVAAIQVDNREFESGQYDFAVVATTRQGGHSPRSDRPRWPCLANIFGDRCSLPLGTDGAGALLRINFDFWSVEDVLFTELTEVELKMGPLALYVEDAYVTALAALADRFRMAGWIEAREDAAVPSSRVLRLRYFHIHALDLNLTLHTSVHMYIALDHSPLHLTEFKMHDLVIINGDLIHALTVHYLSAAVLAAGWVVGGLELLGAPGALALRVGNATGGVRGVAYTVATALLRSVSAWAGSLARNLDLLTGDEEHARRAAANRRNPPQSLFSGLLFGLTNLAVNMLGAVGGIAHHPLLADGVTTAAGLRRGLVGAFAKPLSATADLLAFAGHGLLHQTGWESMPQTLPWADTTTELGLHSEWQRECVLWAFRLVELQVIAGYRVLLNNKPLLLILTPMYLVVVDPDSDKIVDMVNFENCQVAPYRGPIIEMTIKRRQTFMDPNDPQGNDQYQANIEAMARVARYTGALGSHALISLDDRRARLLAAPGHAHALHAALSALAHSNSDTHFRLF